MTHVFVDHAQKLASEYHENYRHLSGAQYMEGFLPTVSVILTHNGYKNDPAMLAAAWLHCAPREAFDEDDMMGRLQTIHDEFSDRVYSLVHAVTPQGLFSADRRHSVYDKAVSTPGAADLLITNRIVDVLVSTALNRERLEFLAKHHDVFANLFEYRVTPKLWTILEQAYPTGMIKKRSDVANLLEDMGSN